MSDQKKSKVIIAVSVVTIVISVIVMCGWVFNVLVLKEIIPGFVPMVFNAALCFVLFGSALLVRQSSKMRYSKTIFATLSVSGAFIGLITLLQFLFHFNTGLDELFITDAEKVSSSHLYPGRMAYNAAVNFSLLGVGFILLTAKSRIANLLAQYLFHAVSILSIVALIGYLYGVSLFNTLLYVSSMATHTAILFLLLSIGAAMLNPTLGLVRLFTGKQIGNQLARRLFGLILIMVIAFGSLRLQARYEKIFTLDIGISLLAVCFLLGSIIILWSTAKWLNRIDTKRSEAEAEVKLMNAELEQRVAERSAEIVKSEEKYRSLIEQASDAIYVLDFGMNFTEVNASMCKIMGYTREELLQMNVGAIIDPEELKTDPLTTSPDITGQSIVRERRFMRKDRSVFTVEINVKKFSDNRILVMARDISERKRIESELKDAELKFRTIAEKSIVGVYIVQHGKFIYVNPRFAGIFGYEPAELINTVPVETIIHKSHRHITTENVRQRMEGEIESVHYEVMGLKKDGTTNWVEFYGSRATLGGVPTIIGSMVDGTERKQAEEELKTSEQKYKLLFDSNPLPLWMIAKDDLSVIAVNDAAARLYGYTKDELLTMDVKALRAEEDREKQLEGYKEELTSSANGRIIRHIKKDRTIMYVQVTAHDIIFDGRPVRLSLTNDITEKLLAEEALKKSEANLQTILNTTDTAYAMFDTQLKVQAFNQRAIDFVIEQYNHVPEKGDNLADFFPRDRFPQFVEYLKMISQGQHINYEADYPKKKGGKVWYDVRLSPIMNERKEVLGTLMALYDITERKANEQNLREAYESIQNHIESIKGMAWKQSHLIRSPVANLQALAKMLKDHPADAEVLAHLQAEVDRLDEIIHEMAKEAAAHNV
ncbi:PAS domain S-box protein [Mucilaginibacter ginsenosidivorans]|uniref:histidine kinase n=1 Tax=Mucilaginibacter ginsenosidivorans TaxID=398053 RepID=A0A5B8UWN6_9SPHI|nr:PAS domain S-box protein [Mucilaginibacter ginsenosidivorans]QEC63474.1 PAS domain S-box protein [Mucilaginibacter ginsenosidivorans]